MGGATFTSGDPALHLHPNGTWMLDLSANPLADGTYDVEVVQTDEGGNSVPDATSDELVIDTTISDPPTVDPQLSMDGLPTAGSDRLSSLLLSRLNPVFSC